MSLAEQVGEDVANPRPREVGGTRRRQVPRSGTQDTVGGSGASKASGVLPEAYGWRDKRDWGMPSSGDLPHYALHPVIDPGYLFVPEAAVPTLISFFVTK